VLRGAAADLRLWTSLEAAEGGSELAGGLTSPFPGYCAGLIENRGEFDGRSGAAREDGREGLRGRVNGAGW